MTLDDDNPQLPPPEPLRVVYGRIAVICGLISLFGLPFFDKPISVSLLYVALLGLVYGLIATVMVLGQRREWRETIRLTILTAFGVTAIVCFGWFYFALRMYAAQPACLGYQRQLAMGITIYAQDHEGHLPPSLAALPATMARTCPVRRPLSITRVPYIYNANLAGQSVARLDHLNEILLLADGLPGNAGLFTDSAQLGLRQHDSGGGVAFLDGHVEYLTSANLTARLAGPVGYKSRIRLVPVER